MPFVFLALNPHACKPPPVRDDGSALVIGDQWQCRAPTPNEKSHANCPKIWEYQKKFPFASEWVEI